MKQMTYSQAATESTEHLFAVLKSSEKGIDGNEAAERRDRFGTNAVGMHGTTARDVFFRQLKSPFIYLLFAAVVIALWTDQAIDAAMIAVFIVINTFLGFYQEYRAEQAAKLLHRFWKNSARVFRKGVLVTLDSTELVPGDIIHLSAGDRIPADVRFLSATNLTADESVLTGEAVASPKNAEEMLDAPGEFHQARNIGFSGTAITTGEATAVVFTTGRASSLGRIVQLTGETTTIGSFEKGISDFSRFILKLIVITLVAVFTLNLGIKGIGQIQELLLFAIALTIGVIPEALPVVMTVVHSRSALQLAERHVIVKRLSSIDDLGSIDILCTDKTGTLTKNRMQVADIHGTHPDACLMDALLGMTQPNRKKGAPEHPFDRALWDAAGAAQKKALGEIAVISELPFEALRKMNSVIHEDAHGKRVLIVRGSPEDVMARCKGMTGLVEIGRYLERQGLSGNRVIAVARKVVNAELVHDVASEAGLTLSGLIAFEDPLKEGAASAIRKAERLGVQIKMLTGDAKEVAGAVAEKIGLVTDASNVITGAEFDALPPEEQIKVVEEYHVFARMNPEQKFRILGLLREKGKAVGYMGEGVNDAPGLKMADVAIAVENASDIAKDAADVILVTKSLSILVDGIELGRKNFANIIKYLNITLASNFGNFYAVAVASLFVPFLPMLPVQILLLNLMTDAPMISIATDGVSAGDLKKPRKYDVRTLIMVATAIGIVSSGFDFLTFSLFHTAGEGYLQTLWFMESVLTEIALIFSLRTSGPFFKGPRVPWSIGALAIGIAVVTFVGPFTRIGQDLFHFVAPSLAQVGIVLLIVVVYFAVTEAVKLRLYKMLNGRHKAVSWKGTAPRGDAPAILG